MLTLEALTLRQGDFRLHADWSLPSGDLTAIIGPSGGGKSTLVAGIAGFITPEAGRVIWDGADLSDLPPGERPVSMIFQDNNLFPHLTAEQNVGLALKPSLSLGGAERARVAEALDRVGLSGLGDRKPAALSGGQQSRVALARTLLADRPLVVMDEPFSALGPGLKAEMLGLVQDLLIAKGRTVLMITHDPEDALRAARNVVLVAENRAHAPQETAAFFTHPPAALGDYLRP